MSFDLKLKMFNRTLLFDKCKKDSFQSINHLEIFYTFEKKK